MKKTKAFTMAEAVLVMTILGIIATIMITTMKPAQFKEKGYQVLAKTLYGDIDTAMTQILVDKAPYNRLDQVYPTNGGATFSMSTGSKGKNLVNLLKLYMATARGTVPANCRNVGYDSGAYMLLKNGACLAVKSGSVTSYTWIPGEESQTPSTEYTYGMIFLDTNGDEEPNTMGKDQFYIPLDVYGIVSGDS